jgi:RNA recognition motif 2
VVAGATAGAKTHSFVPALCNDINIYHILEGQEDRTTVMVRNIPNKFKQRNLLDMIDECHSGKYNYFYLPMDLKVRDSKKSPI